MSNSIGDLKNSGLQGNNWPWQYKMLLGLDKIASLLSAGTEYEAQLVTETCTGPPVTSRILLEVRVWNTDTGTWGPTTYYLPGSSTPVTIAPGCTVAYIDTSAILAQILNVLQDIENGVPEALGPANMVASMPVTIATNQTTIPVTIDCNDRIALCVNGNIVDALNPLPTTASVTFPSSLAVTQDPTSNPWTVDGTVSIGDGADLLEINTDGSINVNATILCDDSSIKICDADGHTLDVNADGSINLGALDATTGTFASLTYTGTGLANGLDVNIINTGLDIRALTCDDKISLCNNGAEVDSSNPLPVSSAALTPTADGVGIYGSYDNGTNWAPIQTDSNGIVSTNTTIVGPKGVQPDCDNAISTALCQTQEDILTDIQSSVAPLTSVIPNILISSGDAPVTIAVPVYSITFFNNGSVDVNVSVDGGTTNALIPAGVTITMDAGGIKNTYPANTFIVGSTIAVGASMIVTYNS